MVFTDSKEMPCLKCNDREIGCHGTCDKYKSSQEYYKKIRDARRLDKIHLSDRTQKLYSQAKGWCI